jgi:hypothetical protein
MKRPRAPADMTIRSYRSRSRGGCAGTGGRLVFESIVIVTPSAWTRPRATICAPAHQG